MGSGVGPEARSGFLRLAGTRLLSLRGRARRFRSVLVQRRIHRDCAVCRVRDPRCAGDVVARQQGAEIAPAAATSAASRTGCTSGTSSSSPRSSATAVIGRRCNGSPLASCWPRWRAAHRGSSSNNPSCVGRLASTCARNRRKCRSKPARRRRNRNLSVARRRVQRQKRVLSGSALLVVLGGLTIGAGILWTSRHDAYVPPSKTTPSTFALTNELVTVPDVVGQHVYKAIAAVTELRLNFGTKFVESDAPVPQVIAQTPARGHRFGPAPWSI